MAGQFHLAFSTTVVGAGVVAGGPWGCASNGSGDALLLGGFDNATRALTGCMQVTGGAPDGGELAEAAAAFAAAPDRPACRAAGDRVYLFHGESDSVVATPVAAAAEAFYRAAGITAEDLHAVYLCPAARPAMRWSWTRTAAPAMPTRARSSTTATTTRPARSCAGSTPTWSAGPGRRRPQDRLRPDRVPGGCRGLGPRPRGRGLYPARLRGCAGLPGAHRVPRLPAEPDHRWLRRHVHRAHRLYALRRRQRHRAALPADQRQYRAERLLGLVGPCRLGPPLQDAPQLAAVRAMLDRLAEPRADRRGTVAPREGVIAVSQVGDSTARVWMADGSGEPVVLRGHKEGGLLGRVQPRRRDLDRHRLRMTGTARVWMADGSGEPVILRGHKAADLLGRFRPDGSRWSPAPRDTRRGCGWPTAPARPWCCAATRTRLPRRVQPRRHQDGHRLGRHRADAGTLTAAARPWCCAATLARSAGPASPRRERDRQRLGRQHAPVGWPTAAASPWSCAATRTRFICSGSAPPGTGSSPALGRTARVWRADGSGEPVVLAATRASPLGGVQPRRHQVLTASDDHTARLWRADGSGPPLVLAVTRAEVTSATVQARAGAGSSPPRGTRRRGCGR